MEITDKDMSSISKEIKALAPHIHPPVVSKPIFLHLLFSLLENVHQRIKYIRRLFPSSQILLH